jgi:hypothetical protein
MKTNKPLCVCNVTRKLFHRVSSVFYCVVMKAILSRHIIYVDILYFNNDLNEAKLKEKVHLFHDSLLPRYLYHIL